MPGPAGLSPRGTGSTGEGTVAFIPAGSGRPRRADLGNDTGTGDTGHGAGVPAAFGLSPAQVADLLRTAGRAPSLHNSQPWLFSVTPHAIELHADARRSPAVADPDGREMRIGCGAALFNLQLGLHGHNIRPIVTILPDRTRHDLIAVVRHGGTKQPTPGQRDLLRVVPVWRTNRHPYTDVPVDTPSLHALRRAALDEGAWLHIVQDPEQRAALRGIAARAHREQEADPAFRAEFAEWAEFAEFAEWISAAPEHRDGVAEPVIAVLSSHLSGPSAEVQVGQALQRVLLTATTNGLAASFLSHLVEVPRTREELRRLIGGARPPQAVLRIGHGRPVAEVPRRAVEDLLTGNTAR